MSSGIVFSNLPSGRTDETKWFCFRDTEFYDEETVNVTAICPSRELQEKRVGLVIARLIRDVEGTVGEDPKLEERLTLIKCLSDSETE